MFKIENKVNIQGWLYKTTSWLWNTNPKTTCSYFLLAVVGFTVYPLLIALLGIKAFVVVLISLNIISLFLVFMSFLEGDADSVEFVSKFFSFAPPIIHPAYMSIKIEVFLFSKKTTFCKPLEFKE